MRRWLPELMALPLLPLLTVQGRRVRRVTPRLPEAAGPDSGIAGAHYAGAPLRLLAVGESPVAGVGVDSHEQAITAVLAREISNQLRRPVSWRACGLNGVTVAEAHASLLPLVPAGPVDLLLVAFGVNDSTSFHSSTRWQADLSLLLESLRQRCGPRLALLSGVPPMGRFPSLPQPLRWVLGLKAAALDRAAASLAAASPGMLHVPMRLDTSAPGLMASDNYHPSAAGCAAWRRELAQAAARHL
jgi:lysophospholipase L1-like esterase